LRVLAWIAAWVCLSGCNYAAYFFRPTREPVDALFAPAHEGEQSRCLVVLMPGMLDTADAYVTNGFFRDARAANNPCDLVAVDAHLGYYQSNTLRERVGRDVLLLAEARGYREIWIVGISMGGLGTMFLAREHPDIVDGVVLFAPFLGDEAVVRGIAEAGGLEAWEPRDAGDWTSQSGYTTALWSWMRGYLEHPDDMPQLYLGVGTEDRLLPVARLLEPAMPPEHFATAPGGHNWTTWRVLWRRLLERPPWGREL
jgi:pimeloyl-ACP methyl ester carboxylesterase